MIRLSVALVGFVLAVSSASAALVSPQHDPSPLGKRLAVGLKHAAAVAQAPTPTEPQEEQMVVTDQTEIRLDGKPCRYADLPQDATIILLEIAADKKTVLKVHFKAGKRK